MLKSKYPMVVCLKEKHGESMAIINSDKGLWAFGHDVLNDRQEQGYWYYGEDDTDALEALGAGPEAPNAWKFLLRRSNNGYEYEGILTETCVKVWE